MRTLIMGSLLLHSLSLTLSFIAWKGTPKIVTVDLPALIRSASAPLAKRYPDGRVPKIVMEKFKNHMDATLHAYAQSHHVWISGQGRIITGNSVDVTDAVMDQFAQNERR